uniref:Uncharacterized protein n=1 Tax=Oryza punctata TaxID=4537 RepID=A0A0E0L8K6_ORYPU
MHLRALLAGLFIAALLMVVSLTCSSSSSSSSSLPLSGADGGDSKDWAGAGGVVRGYHGGGEKAAATARRSLGLRTTKQPTPPAPFPNRMKANAMPVSPPALIG